MQSSISVIIADDHEMARDWLTDMIEGNADLQLLDTAKDADSLVKLVDKHHPDVVITDIKMVTPYDGIEATKMIRDCSPETAVIGFSMYDDAVAVIDMISAGAVGYLVKNASRSVVLEAIRAAHAGKNYYCKSSSELLTALIISGRFNPKDPELLDFTPIELRIIRSICDCKETVDIGDDLNLKYEAYKMHKRKIMEKAGVKTTEQLILWALRNGIYRL